MWALLLALVLPVRAATWPDLSRPPVAAPDGTLDAALVIGIEDYAFAQDLPGARANALAWVSYLRARKVPLVKPLLDAQATREEILVAARQVASKVKPGGTFWLVYIGHGAPARTGDDGLLIGVDAQQTAGSLEARGLAQRDLVATIESSLSREAQAVLVLDACFSGKTAGGDLAPGLAPLKPVSARVESTRVTALTAAKSDEYAGALPDGSRPAFSYLVLGALRGWGDADADGKVTAAEALGYADMSLLQTVTGRSQTPTLAGNGSMSLSTGREQGPDLVALSLRAPTTHYSSGTISGNGGTGFTAGEIDALLAAQERRRAAEAQEAALLTRLRADREEKLSSAVEAKRAEATALWTRMAPLLSAGGPEGKQAAEAFMAAWAEASVELKDAEGTHRRLVGAPEVNRARFWLQQEAVVAIDTAENTGEESSRSTLEALPKLTVFPAVDDAPDEILGAGLKAGARVVTKSGIAMRVIPAGSFAMGCTRGAGACDDDEKPAHTVKLTRSFLLGEAEVTQGQWTAAMGSNPSRFRTCGLDCPVEQVSWLDAVAFANRVSASEGLESCYAIAGESVTWPKGLSCTGYRLPTEAEWEYAARAGRDTAYSGASEVGAIAWYTENSGNETHRVGRKRPNTWGLDDMSGNVWEWTWDGYSAYPTAATDPTGASSGSLRVCRGGSWGSTTQDVRFASRMSTTPGSRFPNLGLRLARSVP